MKLIFAALLAIAFLSSCDNSQVFGSPEKIVPTRDDKTFTMTIEIMPASKIKEYCASIGVPYDANGCSKFNLDTKVCTSYVAAPSSVDDTAAFAIIGHEVWHCRFGKYHQ